MRAAVIAGALLLASQARAAPQPWPLTPLPQDQLLALAPSLRDLDLALIEIDARGALKQLTTMALVAAPRGTLLVLYGYARLPDSGLIDRIVKKGRALEYGLVLIPQMTLLLAMKQRAAALAHAPPLPSPSAAQPNLGFLLRRGVVASF